MENLAGYSSNSDDSNSPKKSKQQTVHKVLYMTKDRGYFEGCNELNTFVLLEIRIDKISDNFSNPVEFLNAFNHYDGLDRF